MHTKLQYFTYGVITTSLLAFSFFTVTHLYAQWSEPPTNPPGGNVDVPVNTGSVSQDKNGGFGANVIAAYDKFNFVFKNTSSNSWPAWRLVRNDGTGNFLIYINSEGGTSPTHETTGPPLMKDTIQVMAFTCLELQMAVLQLVQLSPGKMPSKSSLTVA